MHYCHVRIKKSTHFCFILPQKFWTFKLSALASQSGFSHNRMKFLVTTSVHHTKHKLLPELKRNQLSNTECRTEHYIGTLEAFIHYTISPQVSWNGHDDVRFPASKLGPIISRWYGPVIAMALRSTIPHFIQHSIYPAAAAAVVLSPAPFCDCIRAATAWFTCVIDNVMRCL